MSVGVVLVHGIGEQRPRAFLKEFVVSFVGFLKGEGYAVPFSPSNRIRVIKNVPQIDETVNFYEVYWGNLGEPGSESISKTVRQAIWAARISLLPLARAVVVKEMQLGDRIFVGMLGVGLWLLGVMLHFLNLLAAVGEFFARWARAAGALRRTLLGYIGDVRLYTEPEEWFTRDSIVGLFRQELRRAHDENDRVIVIGHSLGSVIAYNGLTQGVLQNPPPVDRVRAFFTLGSPLAKIAYVWPERISLQPDPAPRANAQPTIRWYNFHDFIDPIGANLGYYQLPADPVRRAQVWRWAQHEDTSTQIRDTLARRFQPPPGSNQPSPLGNFPICSGWFPVGAHVGYWKNKDVLRSIESEVLWDRPPAPLPEEPSFLSVLLRLLGVVVSFSAIISGLFLLWRRWLPALLDSVAIWASQNLPAWIRPYFAAWILSGAAFVLCLMAWLVISCRTGWALKAEILGLSFLVGAMLIAFGLVQFTLLVFSAWVKGLGGSLVGAEAMIIIGLFYATIWAWGRFLGRQDTRSFRWLVATAVALVTLPIAVRYSSYFPGGLLRPSALLLLSVAVGMTIVPRDIRSLWVSGFLLIPAAVVGGGSLIAAWYKGETAQILLATFLLAFSFPFLAYNIREVRR